MSPAGLAFVGADAHIGPSRQAFRKGQYGAGPCFRGGGAWGGVRQFSSRSAQYSALPGS